MYSHTLADAGQAVVGRPDSMAGRRAGVGRPDSMAGCAGPERRLAVAEACAAFWLPTIMLNLAISAAGWHLRRCFNPLVRIHRFKRAATAPFVRCAAQSDH